MRQGRSPGAICEELDRLLEELIQHARIRQRFPADQQTTLRTSTVSGRRVAIVLLPDSCKRTLTKREQQVVSMLGRELGNAGIARELGISENTVKAHLKSASERWGLHSRAALARCAAVLYSYSWSPHPIAPDRTHPIG